MYYVFGCPQGPPSSLGPQATACPACSVAAPRGTTLRKNIDWRNLCSEQMARVRYDYIPGIKILDQPIGSSSIASNVQELGFQSYPQTACAVCIFLSRCAGLLCSHAVKPVDISKISQCEKWVSLETGAAWGRLKAPCDLVLDKLMLGQMTFRSLVISETQTVCWFCGIMVSVVSGSTSLERLAVKD